jgi:hypothetical protein
MDPKSLNNIDPKLRETYERVMGTSAPTPEVTTAPPPAVPDQTPVTPTPMLTTPEMPSTAIPSGVPETPANTSNQPEYQKDNLQFQAAIQSPFGTSFSSTAPAEPAEDATKKPSSTLKFLYIGGAIVFFIAYTFFWIKVFNLPTPF